jgi:hypothetical protein
MRKLISILLLSFIFGNTQANAQTEKGTLLLGGNTSLQLVDDASLFVFNANLGVFVSNKFAIGLQANILSSEGTSAWALGPFARLYFTENPKGKPFGQVSLNLGGGDGSDVSLGGGLTAGYAFFLNQSIALEVAANYFRIDDSGLLVIGAGFQIHFRKQK